MSKRPTIEDLAREAGVSVATVDRVLNGRSRVREETANRVYEAAVALNYHATSLIEQRIHAELPEYRLGFLLQKEKQHFYQDFERSIMQAAKRLRHMRVVPEIYYMQNQSPQDCAEGLLKLGRRNQAVAGVCMDHHQVTLAVQELQNKGVGVYALLSDFAQGQRQSYIGLNNLRVGRTTAWMIAKIARQGKVALFVGGHRWHGHELRETGFRSYFREYAPDFQILDTLVNLETRQLTYEATLDLLDRHPDLRGLYCAGGGMEGAIEAIREVQSAGQITLVVNEDTPLTRQALLDRYLTMANVTPLDAINDVAIRKMIEGIESKFTETPSQLFIPQNFLFPEMI